MQEADILIVGGRIYEGRGERPWIGDIAIKDGKITGLGDLRGWRGKERLEAGELAVAPGFIDMHTHSDLSLMINPRAESYIRQGVTTVVIGQCGFSPAPAPEKRRAVIKSLFGEWGRAVEWKWASYGGYLATLETARPSVNVAPIVGHGVIRAGVMGMENRAPTGSELDVMRGEIKRAMEEGALGFSSGLVYVPGSFADREELTVLAREMGENGGIYFSHVRGEDERAVEAVGEAVEIGRRAGVRVQVSHLKVEGRKNWGKIGRVLEVIEGARREGVEVGFDIYPYTAWNTDLSQILPAWAREGGSGEMICRLIDPALRARVAAEVAASEVGDPGRWERRIVASVGSSANKGMQGLSIAEIAAWRHRPPVQVVLDILVEEKGDADMIGFGMSEEDVREGLSHPVATIGSDSAAQAPYGLLGKGHPHPRTYGSFVRALGHYAREEKLFGLEEGIAKMTGRAAVQLGLKDRGLIAEGMAADIVVFDPDSIGDAATYQEPHQYAKGVRWVIVNGLVEIDGETHNGRGAGKVLRRSAAG